MSRKPDRVPVERRIAARLVVARNRADLEPVPGGDRRDRRARGARAAASPAEQPRARPRGGTACRRKSVRSTPSAHDGARTACPGRRRASPRPRAAARRPLACECLLAPAELLPEVRASPGDVLLPARAGGAGSGSLHAATCGRRRADASPRRRAAARRGTRPSRARRARAKRGGGRRPLARSHTRGRARRPARDRGSGRRVSARATPRQSGRTTSRRAPSPSAPHAAAAHDRRRSAPTTAGSRARSRRCRPSAPQARPTRRRARSNPSDALDCGVQLPARRPPIHVRCACSPVTLEARDAIARPPRRHRPSRSASCSSSGSRAARPALRSCTTVWISVPAIRRVELVPPHEAGLFEAQVRHVARHYDVVPADRLLDAVRSRRRRAAVSRSRSRSTTTSRATRRSRARPARARGVGRPSS